MQEAGWIGRTVLALALCGVLAACGESSQEQALVEASENLAAARERVEASRDKVASRRQQVEDARAELDVAEQELREAQTALRKAESRIDVTATDAALFRAVQKRLLEEDDLRQVAIAVDVDRGVATLRGRVPKAKLRDRAVEVAKSVPGVASVESRIAIAPPAVAAPPPQGATP